MSNIEQEALIAILPKLRAIPAEDIKSPNMPIATFATECESLKETYLKDTPHFATRKIDTALLATQLDEGVNALREAEMVWREESTIQKDATKQWNALKDEAYALREEVEASLDFILDDGGESRKQLNDILAGTGHNDMIFDLGKCARLAKVHAEELNAIAFTDAQTARLEELYTLLTDIYGKVNSDKADTNVSRIMRDRVFTYCHSIQTKIKKAARLVFRTEHDMLARYRSEYGRQQNRAN